MKLEKVEEIEKGLTSIEEVAKLFNIKKSIVQLWIASKAELEEKCSKKKQVEQIDLNAEENLSFEEEFNES